MKTISKSAEQAGAKAPAKARRKWSEKQMRSGSWNTFVWRFKPILNTDDGGFVDIHRLPKAIDPHLVWTLVDEDGHWYLIPGRWLVNRLAYVICQVPWTEDQRLGPSYLYG